MQKKTTPNFLNEKITLFKWKIYTKLLIKKIHQTKSWNTLHGILIHKSYTKWIIKKLNRIKQKYTKRNHEIFYTEFLF